MHYIFAGLIATAALAPVGSSRAADPIKFYGLSAGQVSAFTRTPDGCVLSLLFDNFRAPAERQSTPDTSPLRTFSIVASKAAAGQRMTFTIRGARINADAAAVQLDVAGQKLTLKPTSDEFLLFARARTDQASADTLVKVALVLPSSTASDPNRLLEIDSIDISLTRCGVQPGAKR